MMLRLFFMQGALFNSNISSKRYKELHFQKLYIFMKFVLLKILLSQNWKFRQFLICKMFYVHSLLSDSSKIYSVYPPLYNNKEILD